MKKLIRNAKRNLEKRLANEKNNKRPFYAYVKGKTKSCQTVGPLKREDGKTTETDKETAEELNKFFVSGACTARKTQYHHHQREENR